MAWYVFFRLLNPAAASRFDSSSRVPISALSLNLNGGNVCTWGPEMGSVFIQCKPWWPNSRNGLAVGIDGNVATGGTLTLPWRLNNTAPAEGDRTFGRHG